MNKLSIYNRLRVQISIVVGVCLFVGMMLYGFFEVEQLSKASLLQKERESVALAHNIATSVQVFILEKNYVAIERLLSKSTHFPDISNILVVDDEGRIISEIEKSGVGFSLTFRFGEVVPPKNDAPAVFTGPNSIIAWQPVTLGNAKMGWVKVTEDLSFINQNKVSVWENTFIAGISIFIFSFTLLQLWLNRRIKSISLASMFAASLSDNYGQKISIRMGSYELDNLAESLNNTSERLYKQEKELLKKTLELELSNATLGERVKELDCLYAVSHVLSETETSVNHKLQSVTDLLPGGWQFPDKACARVSYLNNTFLSEGFVETAYVCYESINLDNEFVGLVEIFYKEDVGKNNEVPFLSEEQKLLEEVVKRLVAFFVRDNTEKKLKDSYDELEIRVQLRTRDLELAKKSAEKANQEKSSFLARMSHELRTPMNAILGFSQILQFNDEQNLTENQLESIGLIYSSGQHLLALINEVLDLSKIESGSVDIKSKKISVFEMMCEIDNVMKPLASQENVSLNFLTDFDHRLEMMIDPVKLKQIMFNLVNNAVKYNRQGGEVTVEVEELSEYIRFNVRDTGFGMSDDQLEKIFEPFERLGKEYETEGTGIGLTVTKRLIEHMGGKIGVESMLDKGSTFWFEFQKNSHASSDEDVKLYSLL